MQTKKIVYLKNKTKKTENTMVIRFASGIIGFELCKNFILKETYGGNLNNGSKCMWLESSELENVKFLVLVPKQNSNKFTSEEDILNISEHLRVKRNKLLFLYIVTVQDKSCTINTRAPLIIDLDTKEGWQFILGDEYEIKHSLENGLHV